jgi:hypothetical protein
MNFMEESRFKFRITILMLETNIKGKPENLPSG